LLWRGVRVTAFPFFLSTPPTLTGAARQFSQALVGDIRLISISRLKSCSSSLFLAAKAPHSAA
jgi:hypothetical protein